MSDLEKMRALIQKDERCMRALEALARLRLPDGWLAAGAIRDLVWDSLFHTKTERNDLDVIYFHAEETSQCIDRGYEESLRARDPDLDWSVKNQARMHLKNGDRPYLNALDAMRFWPEKETGVAARLDNIDQIEIIHAFPLDSLFEGKISHNPNRALDIFTHRITSKGWLKRWPGLQISTSLPKIPST